MNRTEHEFELMRRYLEGVASLAEMQELESLIVKDASVRQDFLRYTHLDSALAGVRRSQPLVVAPRRSVWLSWRPLAAAAALVLFVGGWVIGSSTKRAATLAEKPEAVDDGVALLTQVVDANWKGTHQPRAGSILSAGRLQLASGLAQLEFYSGARVILEGPADLELVSANRAVCHSGRIRAWVPPQARGFQVVSPEFELIDLGTEFGMEVGGTTGSKVEVFDGEVELHPADAGAPSSTPLRLLGGAGIAWASTGQRTDIRANASGFPSFDDVRSRADLRAKERYAAWQQWNREVSDDSRIAVRYDFEKLDGRLIDSGPQHVDGSIIGCEVSNGRWAEKGALEFKRPSDRVRVNIPGSYDTLTLSAWIRLDGITGRMQGLLLTDGYERGFPHWQIAESGQLRLGLLATAPSGALQPTGYGSPELFQPRRVGVWTFIATTYDNHSGKVRHFLNGKEVSAESLVSKETLQIGKADIGNWGLPLDKDWSPVRNFVGRIDEMTLWKVALTESELLDIYEQTRP